MAYADGRILEELLKLNKSVAGVDNKSDLGQMLTELRLLRLAVAELIDVDLEQINVDTADAVSTI